MDQVILAPMVRVGTLPMRLLAVEFGATMVYAEEIIDRKILNASRTVNEAQGTTEFRLPEGNLVFATVPEEPVVFQLGTADAATAVRAAEVVARDVRAVDVNMGCPKHFSMSGGMGAALLRRPEVAEDILKTLKRNLNIPVTCKIRLLEDPKDTSELVRRLQNCGIEALAVHGRRTLDRSRYAADYQGIAQVVSEAQVPVIHNADIFYHQDILEMKKRTGAHSVMIARGAQWNCSVFRSQGMLPVYDVMRKYLDIAEKFDNLIYNTKFCIIQMIKNQKVPGDLANRLSQAKTSTELRDAVLALEGLPRLMGEYCVPEKLIARELMPDYYAKELLKMEKKKNKNINRNPVTETSKRYKVDELDDG